MNDGLFKVIFFTLYVFIFLLEKHHWITCIRRLMLFELFDFPIG